MHGGRINAVLCLRCRCVLSSAGSILNRCNILAVCDLPSCVYQVHNLRRFESGKLITILKLILYLQRGMHGPCLWKTFLSLPRLKTWRKSLKMPWMSGYLQARTVQIGGKNKPALHLIVRLCKSGRCFKGNNGTQVFTFMTSTVCVYIYILLLDNK